MIPIVTFVIPCYNLAHLLHECINSILVQSFENYEIIIMDDCSPDATPEVAESFGDPRVRYIRNEKNLKHLANYNKGIGLARGKYVWLISADDRLAKPYILERYIELMEEHPEVGIVFCPALGLKDGKETGLLEYSFHGDQDKIFPGKRFLKKLLEANSVVAVSAMARKACYEKISYFPLDMPYAGDWYLWCQFSLHFDVAYFPEPMVYYRQHTQSMTNILKETTENLLFEDDVKVLSRVRDKARIAKLDSIAMKCNEYVASRYVNHFLVQEKMRSDKLDLISLWRFDNLLDKHTSEAHDLAAIRANINMGIADWLYWKGEMAKAKDYYKLAVKAQPKLLKARMKYILLLAGKYGGSLRNMTLIIKKQKQKILELLDAQTNKLKKGSLKVNKAVNRYSD